MVLMLLCSQRSGPPMRCSATRRSGSSTTSTARSAPTPPGRGSNATTLRRTSHRRTSSTCSSAVDSHPVRTAVNQSPSDMRTLPQTTSITPLCCWVCVLHVPVIDRPLRFPTPITEGMPWLVRNAPGHLNVFIQRQAVE